MGSFTRWGRIATAAGSLAFLSVETVLLESPKGVSSVDNTKLERHSEEAKRAAVKKIEQKKLEELKAAARRSKGPVMAPQFDGLNFYETFIGAPQR